MKKYIILPLIIILISSCAAKEKLHEEYVDYMQGNTELEGFLVYDESLRGKRPGIVIVHQWMGLSENERMRARMFAKLGYVAFAADIYGKGIRPENRKEAAEQAGKYRTDRQLLRKRVKAAVDWVKSYRLSDRNRTAAVGYCFGGGAVLELARSGYRTNAVISFHGNLDTDMPAKKGEIQAKVLVHHGAIDPHVSKEGVFAFQKEMEDAGGDWTFISYGHAVHAFTQKEAGNDPSKGAAYNKKADERSWYITKKYLKELFY